MMGVRLFVDVDDTLILWPKLGPGPLIAATEENADMNEDVRLFALRWKAYNPSGEIIIWSSGGSEYARKWGAKSGLPYSYCWSKAPMPVLKGDMFIDDDPMPAYRERNIHPDLLKGCGLVRS